MGTHILHRNVEHVTHEATPSRVFMFPGQSSVGPAVLLRACASHTAAVDVEQRVRAVLGNARASEYFSAHGARLITNRDTQITVFVATQMYLAALHAEGVDAKCSLGLSLGEYSHLVHIGALDFEDALRLVDERGRCYDEAPPGIMATVLAVDYDTVAGAVEQARVHGPIAISNVNAPTQHVVAGAEAAVMWAAAYLEDEHAAHVAVIERRVPMHSPMMAAVADQFVPALAAAPWRRPAHDYFPNVSGAPLPAASPADFVSHLKRHVSEPVLWQRSLDHLVSTHPEATFIEVGPGGVLHNMMGRAWRSVRRLRVDGPDTNDPGGHFASVVEALRA
jgi:[acyl-carrier-protein] S-malonyltransferase